MGNAKHMEQDVCYKKVKYLNKLQKDTVPVVVKAGDGKVIKLVNYRQFYATVEVTSGALTKKTILIKDILCTKCLLFTDV